MNRLTHFPRWTRWAADGALGLVTLLAYWPALTAGFIWDDDAHVTRAELQSWRGLGRIWFEPGATQQYYPVLHSAFWLEHRLWGQAPLGYHLLNLGLHAVAALLLVRVLLNLLDPAWPPALRQGGAYLAAALFALHPVGVESVAWIAEQKNTLSTVCALSAVLCYLRFDHEWEERDLRARLNLGPRSGLESDWAQRVRRSRSAWLWYAVGTGWLIAALLAKSVTATVPAALLVAMWWRRGRLDGRRDWLPLAPWLALGAAMGACTAWMERTQIGAQGSDFALTWVQRAMLAGRATWFYLGKLAWPSGLIFVYPRWSIDPGQPAQWLGLLGALALLATAWLFRRRSRGPLAALLLFGGLLFPALGFLNVYPFIFSYVADHFAYLASVSFCAALSIGYCGAVRRSVSFPLLRRGFGGQATRLTVAIALPMGILAAFAAATHTQAATYRDSETLYRTTLARNPAAWLAQLNLGGMLLERGQLAEAQARLTAAESLQPDFPLTHFDLGQLYLRQNEMAAAAAEFRASLRLHAEDAEACNNLGIALASRGERDAADEQFAAALRIRPDYPLALCNWSIVLMQQQRWADARGHVAEALRLQPGNALAQELLKQLPPDHAGNGGGEDLVRQMPP
jgi:Tfp pilus assembly protein PilF